MYTRSTAYHEFQLKFCSNVVAIAGATISCAAVFQTKFIILMLTGTDLISREINFKILSLFSR